MKNSDASFSLTRTAEPQRDTLCVNGSIAEAAPRAETQSIEITLKNRIVNIFVRLIILMRGSKKLFASESNSKAYLGELKGKQTDYMLKQRLKSDVSLSKIDAMQCFLLTKKGSTSTKKIIYLPGGAFVREPTSLHWSMLDRLCQSTGAQIHIIVYAKAPTHTYLDTYPQLVRLYSGLLETTAAEDITIMGDSSGAAIAVTLTQWLKNEGVKQPGKLVLYSPLLDLTLSNSEIQKTAAVDPMLGIDGLRLFVDAWLAGESVDSPTVNPIACDLSVLPETDLHCGTADVMIYDSERFFDMAKRQSGKPVTLFKYEGMYHCFMLYPVLRRRLAPQAISAVGTAGHIGGWHRRPYRGVRLF